MIQLFTRFTYSAFFAALFLLSGFSARAQSFTQTSPYDTLAIEHDTLRWTINAPVTAGIWGTAELTIYFQADLGDGSESLSIYAEDGTMLTIVGGNDNDCMIDSASVSFPVSMISPWAADNNLDFYAVSSDEVNVFCDSNHARIKLSYNYCLAGPIALLQLPQTRFCAVEDAVEISATPPGGILSGPGLTLTHFDPQNVSPGSHTLTYTLENDEGCTSYSEVEIFIRPATVATASDYSICPLESVTFTYDYMGHVVWFRDPSATDSIGSGSDFTMAVPETASYYAAVTMEETYFTLESLEADGVTIIETDTIIGDDRGGIAVTDNYIYIGGDSYTARYDLDLQNGVALPINDGLFSDLGNAQLYSLYNPLTGTPDFDANTLMYVTQIRSLNDDLTFGSTTITLSDSIAFGYDQSTNYGSGLFAGNGFTLIYSAYDSIAYVIDLHDGVVTKLGHFESEQLHAYQTEIGAFWGIAEFNEEGYSVLYRDDNSNNILRYNLVSGTLTTAASFSDLDEMASFTYAPWNNRWYMHFEGGSQFDLDGLYNETLMFADASDSTGASLYAGTLTCPAEVTITVTSTPIDINGGGSICLNDAPVALSATPAGGTFSGPGITGSTFNPNTAGMGTHTVLYTYLDEVSGCQNYDSVVYVIDCTLGLEESETAGISIYPNPAKELLSVDLGTINSTLATFTIYDASGRSMLTQSSNGSAVQQLDVSQLGNGTYLLLLNGETIVRKLFMISK